MRTSVKVINQEIISELITAVTGKNLKEEIIEITIQTRKIIKLSIFEIASGPLTST